MSAIPAVRFSGVTRRFGDIAAVEDVSFDIVDGEFFAILGPSGSGKTTCLRLIAGFDRSTSGTIELYGTESARLPPYERDVNTVFQDYALFPHMTVAENVGYGLMIRRVAKDQRARRVAEMLELVQLPGVGARRPGQLSGGQRQRVALARALANRPRVLLLDEPLGALDLKLRQQMQVELKALQKQLGITFVHVTHDQEEALAMSDRLAVFSHGHLEQIGAPAEVYENPRTAFVADFLGVSNLLRGDAARAVSGSAQAISIRPEKIRIEEPEYAAPDGQVSVAGAVTEAVYLGMHTRYVIALDLGATLTVVEQNHDVAPASGSRQVGDRVRLVWSREHNRPVRE